MNSNEQTSDPIIPPTNTNAPLSSAQLPLEVPSPSEDVEAPLRALTEKTLAEMTDEELEQWHSRLRDINTSHSTFLSAVRTKEKATSEKRQTKAPSGEEYA